MLLKKHKKKQVTWKKPQKERLFDFSYRIDLGKYHNKFVLLDEQEEILDSFYAPNEGDLENAESSEKRP